MYQQDEILINFGKHISKLRQKQKLSQEILASKANLHRTHIGMIERAERNISLLNINKLANGLGVSINELSGFDNEDRIIEALNGKKFDDLNQNSQQLIMSSFSNYSGLIVATKQAGQNKSDLKITIWNESHTYSIKKGTGNSIHQEPIEPFLEFLEEFNITDEIKDSLRLFIWGDGTLDGSGDIVNRLSAPQFKKQFPQSDRVYSKLF